MNKVVIFGSTGMTGLCALQAAVDKGLTVRAFVRTASKVPESLRDKVEIVVGNVLTQSDVDAAVKGTDGVVVALGTNNDLSPTTDLSQGLKNIMAAMRAVSLDTISVCISAFLFYDPEKVPERYAGLNADHKRMYEALKESDFKYIAVFPPHIADGPSKPITVEYDKSPGRSVSKLDLGKFLVDSLSQPEYFGRVVGIANV